MSRHYGAQGRYHAAVSEPPDPRLLHPAIEATRRYLSDLEDDQVPHALRAVRLSSARRLPPPLANVVIRELGKSEDLRSEVADLLDPSDGSSAGAVARAFLARPEGWETVVSEAIAESAERAERELVATLRSTISDLESELNRAREKLKATKRRAARANDDAKRRIAELKRLVTDQDAPAKQEELRLQRVEQEANEQQAELKAELSREKALVTQLRTRLLRSRRSRGPGESSSPGPGMLRSQPVDIAKSLDALASVAAPVPSPNGVDDQERPRFGLPPGVRPDGKGAIEWLLARTTPTTVVVDGYNAGWLIDAASFASAEGRNEVVRRAARIRKAAVAPTRLIVVFDSEHGQTDETALGSVDVRWAVSADDYIRDLAESLEGDVVVISTDREVQEGSAIHGAVVLWSEAFVRWSSG